MKTHIMHVLRALTSYYCVKMNSVVCLQFQPNERFALVEIFCLAFETLRTAYKFPRCQHPKMWSLLRKNTYYSRSWENSRQKSIFMDFTSCETMRNLHDVHLEPQARQVVPVLLLQLLLGDRLTAQQTRHVLWKIITRDAATFGSAGAPTVIVIVILLVQVRVRHWFIDFIAWLTRVSSRYSIYRYYRRYSGIISNRRCFLGVRPNAFQIEDIAECKSSSNDQKSKNKPLNIGMIFGISSIWKSFVPLPFFVFFAGKLSKINRTLTPGPGWPPEEESAKVPPEVGPGRRYFGILAFGGGSVKNCSKTMGFLAFLIEGWWFKPLFK